MYVCCYGASRHSSIVCHFSDKTSTSVLIKEQKKTKLEAKKLLVFLFSFLHSFFHFLKKSRGDVSLVSALLYGVFASTAQQI